MIRLTRYLRPYLPMVLIAIVLLFAQANFDLALPDYLSRIVNVGIQQGGVESAVPLAVRQSQMERLMIFIAAEEQAEVLAAYTLVDQDAPQYADAVRDYPVLESEAVYVLNDVEEETIEQLNPVMGRAILVVSMIERVVADPSLVAEMGGDFTFDPGMIPPGMDVFAFLQQLPAPVLERMGGMIDERFGALGEKMIVQAAAAPILAEYAALGMDTESLQTRYILRVGGWMLLLTLLSGLCTIAVGYLSARTAAGAARDVRRGLFRRVESFSNAEFDAFSTASLITRSTNDITQIQMVIIFLVRMVFYAPIMGVGGVIRAVGKGGSMGWIIAVAVLVLIGLVLIITSIALPKFKALQQMIDRINLVARESLSGMMVIRAFNRQAFEERRFDEANLDLTAVSLFVNRLIVVMMPTMMLIMNGLFITIMWVGAHQVAEANMQVGDMIAFIQYAMQIVMSFLMLTMLFIILPRASVSADRIAEVLDTEPAIRDPEQPLQFPVSPRGRIEFRDVSFRYPDALDDVLCNITFTAEPGQTTAFIGSTGSGKSTLVNLIPRFYDVTEGAILVDGVDVRHVTQHDLRERIGYIPQTGILFSGTIESNLRYADEDASAETVREAVDIAQASEFIFAHPAGMDAEISQGGTNVSGGQKQRLAIARALVKKPPIYIFDDSFSALDFRTEYALRMALKEKTGQSTVLVVTQRVSTIKNAEQIVVLDEGRIVGKGTHRQLMETCQTYREIALSQLSVEELA
ncbi:MAG: ABC transporter ATP-binding protein [Anaerolineae bacterium]|nr:ABC transporter ATP-binding protein [Anaerolineae bacterium]